MNKIFKKPEGKSCSCSTGKKCAGCKKQKSIKPVVYIEEPRRLPTSIVISRLTKKRNQHKEENKVKQINKLHTEEKKKVEKLNKLYSDEEKRILKQRKSDEKRLEKTNEQYKEENKAKQINKLHTEEKKKVEKLNKLYLEKEKRILRQRKSDEKKLEKKLLPPAAKKRLPSLRSWYRQRRALIRLEHERRKEGKDKAKEKENEALHALEQAKAEAKKARRKVTAREATAKPVAHSKYASVKHASKTNKTLTYRFVNFCNKLCCQCYCYFSIIFILGFMFIYFL